jgi:pyruvate formate lyase activating enzyme
MTSQRQTSVDADPMQDSRPGLGSCTGEVSHIQFYNVHDGPGIRTVVFLKGCPLRCQWCSNPETMSTERELGLKRNLCTACEECLSECGRDALYFDDEDILRVRRDRCDSCGDCVPSCLPGALTLYGQTMTAREVFTEIHKDRMFYGNEGGATISGGEPLLQPSFVSEVFQLCRADGISTCLETAGNVGRRAWEQVLPHTDLILYDLKHMDSDRHRRMTGASNELILDNARWLAGSTVPMLFRVPLIPGFNDSPGAIEELAEFVGSLPRDSIEGIELMPFHRMAVGKYDSLDKEYRFADTEVPPESHAESRRQQIEAQGIPCRVSR